MTSVVSTADRPLFCRGAFPHERRMALLFLGVRNIRVVPCDECIGKPGIDLYPSPPSARPATRRWHHGRQACSSCSSKSTTEATWVIPPISTTSTGWCGSEPGASTDSSRQFIYEMKCPDAGFGSDPGKPVRVMRRGVGRKRKGHLRFLRSSPGPAPGEDAGEERSGSVFDTGILCFCLPLPVSNCCSRGSASASGLLQGRNNRRHRPLHRYGATRRQ